jgi:RHS repeat-associated protein
VAEGAKTIINWSYDNLNRLLSEDYNAPGDGNDFVHEYSYDLVGNRTKKTVDGSAVTDYSYNNADQLTQETTDGNNITYGYDDNGALVLKDAGDDPNVYYTYNLRGRLSQVDIENGVTVSYICNPDGIRVRSVVDGNPTGYVIDAYNHTGYAQVLKEVGDTNTVYITGHDVLAQATGASDPQYFLYDGHGSVRQLVSNAASVIENYNFDAYGNLYNFAGTPASRLLYSGEWRDQHTGLDNLRSRWYEPLTGRFTRIDEFAGNNQDPQSLHKYLYAHCNPIDNIDPGGQFAMVGTFLNILNVASIIATALPLMMKSVQIGSGFKQLNVLSDLMIRLAATPLDVLTQIQIRNHVFRLAVHIINHMAMQSLEIIRDVVYGAAFAIASVALLSAVSGLIAGVVGTIRVKIPHNLNVKKMAKVRMLGDAGEEAVGIVAKKKRIPSLSGKAKWRVPDELTDLRLREVKNRAYVCKTGQIEDFLLYTQKFDMEYILEIRGTTKVAKTLLDLKKKNLIIIKRTL